MTAVIVAGSLTPARSSVSSNAGKATCARNAVSIGASTSRRLREDALPEEERVEPASSDVERRAMHTADQPRGIDRIRVAARWPIFRRGRRRDVAVGKDAVPERALRRPGQRPVAVHGTTAGSAPDRVGVA